jgi:hypothetical protein
MRKSAIIGVALISAFSIISSVDARAPQLLTPQESEQRLAWVEQSLLRMEAVKPGMTRGDLLKVFTTEGGLSNAVRRTYVSRECLLFKVDVDFEIVGRPTRDGDGRVTTVESATDLIKAISKPYLARVVID